MDLFKILLLMFPNALPLIDFTVQDDGPTPVLRPGVDGRFRYNICPLSEDEQEEVEGVHYRMVVDYNCLTEGVDYDIVERGPYIAAWNLPHPQPTEAELQAAWDEIKDLPPEPRPLTAEERLVELEAENKLFQARNQALLDRAEFIEEAIAEMAVQVYQ